MGEKNLYTTHMNELLSNLPRYDTSETKMLPSPSGAGETGNTECAAPSSGGTAVHTLPSKTFGYPMVGNATKNLL
jgi:hypothetical protein